METAGFVELRVKNNNDTQVEIIKLPSKYAGVNIEDYTSQPDYCPDMYSTDSDLSNEFYETQENVPCQIKIDEEKLNTCINPDFEDIPIPDLVEIPNLEEKQGFEDMPELIEENQDFEDIPDLVEIPNLEEKQDYEDTPEFIEENQDFEDIPDLVEIPDSVKISNPNPVENPEQFKEITTEEAYAFRAIEMWYNVVYRCRLLATSNHADNYRDYISNVLTQKDVKTITKQIRKVIVDFYDYFYIKKHIAHMNYRQYEKLTDDYAQFKTIVVSLKSGIREGVSSREGKELINILIEVSMYAFEKITPFRKKWGLYVYEEEKQDEYLVKYYSDYDERKNEKIE